MRAVWRPVGRLPDGDNRSIEDPAGRRDSQRNRLGAYCLFDQYTDDVGRSFVIRNVNRPGDLAGDCLHHRGGQTGTAWLIDLIRTDTGVIRNVIILLKRRLPGLALGRLAEHHLFDCAHHYGAALGAGIAHLACLERAHRRRQKVARMVNSICLLDKLTRHLYRLTLNRPINY